jgi:hypothetical protein
MGSVEKSKSAQKEGKDKKALGEALRAYMGCRVKAKAKGQSAYPDSTKAGFLGIGGAPCKQKYKKWKRLAKKFEADYGYRPFGNEAPELTAAFDKSELRAKLTHSSRSKENSSSALANPKKTNAQKKAYRKYKSAYDTYFRCKTSAMAANLSYYPKSSSYFARCRPEYDKMMRLKRAYESKYGSVKLYTMPSLRRDERYESAASAYQACGMEAAQAGQSYYPADRASTRCKAEYLAAQADAEAANVSRNNPEDVEETEGLTNVQMAVLGAVVLAGAYYVYKRQTVSESGYELDMSRKTEPAYSRFF